MLRTRMGAPRSQAEQAQVAADVDALMAALHAHDQPRQSPIYRWLDIRHDELLASLGGQRVKWVAFAAHLTTLGLTDGKDALPTPSVARNTWHRVKAARGAAGSIQSSAPSIAVPAPAPVDHHGGEADQDGRSTSAPGVEVSAQDREAAEGGSAHDGVHYPPGIRALAAPDPAPASPGDGATADPDSLQANLPAASDSASPVSSLDGEHRTAGPVSWTAKFPSEPPPGVLKLLRQNGGQFDREHVCWSGATANGLDDFAVTVRSAGGSLQTSPSVQPLM